MTSRIAIPALLAASALGAAAPAMGSPAPASPARVVHATTNIPDWALYGRLGKVSRFKVGVKGVQRTDWEEARHEVTGDCFHKNFFEAEGYEEITLRTPKPAEVIATSPGPKYVMFAYGRQGQDPLGFRVKAQVERQYASRAESLPGDCGGGAPPVISPLGDCGFGSLAWDATLTHANGRIGVQAVRAGAGPPYASCPMYSPVEVTELGLTQIDSALPISEIHDKRLGKLIVLGHQEFVRHEDTAFGGRRHARTTVDWTLTLTRLKGPAPPLPVPHRPKGGHDAPSHHPARGGFCRRTGYRPGAGACRHLRARPPARGLQRLDGPRCGVPDPGRASAGEG